MIATYYTHSPGRLADGTLYNSGYFCAAPKRFKLGQKLRIAYPVSGRRITVTVRDRGCSHLDLSQTAFKALVGPRYKVIGKVTVKIL